MKKLLSIVLALSLCLTAMMGCFVVSAETVATDATITVGTDSAKPGEAVAITVTGANFTDVCAAELEIALPSVLTLDSIYNGETELVNTEDNAPYYVVNNNVIKTVEIYNFTGATEDDTVATTEFVLTINATVSAEAEHKDYTIDAEIVAGDIDENLRAVEVTDGKVTVEHTIAYTVEDETHTAYCTGCEYAEDAVEHTYTDGECVCGAVEEVEHVCSGEWVYDSENRNYTRTCECGITDTKELEYSADVKNITSSGKSLSLRDAVAIVYYFEKPDVDTVGTVDGLFLKVVQTLGDGSGDRETYLTDWVLADFGYNVQEYRFTYTGIAAKELGDAVKATLYIVVDGTAYPCTEIDYNVVSYARNQLAKNNALLKTALVDLLNYGAEAQKRFEYNVNNLVNAFLTEEQLALGTQNMPTLTDYRANVNDGHTPVENTSPSLSFQSNVQIIYYCKVAETYTGDKNNLTLVVDNGESVTVIPFSEWLASAGEYKVYYSGLAARQMRSICTFKVYENYGTEGQVQLNNDMTYSIETFAARQNDTKKDYATAIAMMKYGDSATVYLNSLS